MKKVIIMHIEDCPYCRQARKAAAELYGENHDFLNIEIEWIDEKRHPEIAEALDYYYVPSAFADGQKMYEAHPGESYEECKDALRKAFITALD